MYKERLNKVARKKICWENMAVIICFYNFSSMQVKDVINFIFYFFQGVPLQTGVRDCGLFVMGYMKEICYDKELQFANKV